jgi:hypothetical protein
VKKLVTEYEQKLNEDNKLKDLLNNYNIKIEGTDAILYNKSGDKIGDIILIYNNCQFLPSPLSSTRTQFDNITNQMLRIKDSRVTATKMVLMHLVTGQNYKHGMVEKTINLTENLWNATNISFKQIVAAIGGGKYINYKEKYLKYRTKYLKLKYN